LQRIAEFSDDETTIYLADAKKVCKTYNMKELLPQNFIAAELKR
jgi:cytidine deaminase